MVSGPGCEKRRSATEGHTGNLGGDRNVTWRLHGCMHLSELIKLSPKNDEFYWYVSYTSKKSCLKETKGTEERIWYACQLKTGMTILI